MSDAEWERGDLLGHDFPIHLEALRGAGPTFLTSAFRASGAMGEDNRVTAIAELEPFAGGSTGRKAVLRVTYEHPDPNLPERLFVKFSRDLDNEIVQAVRSNHLRFRNRLIFQLEAHEGNRDLRLRNVLLPGQPADWRR